MSRDSGDADKSEEKPEWLSGKLAEMLTCPATGGKLVWDRERGELVSPRANLAYPIRSGIPIMLIGEARKLES